MLRGIQHAVVDMTRWYNFTTFDLIGDPAFGEPFGCLESKYHWWVTVILDAVKASAYPHGLLVLSNFAPTVILLVPRHLLKKRKASFNLSVEKVRRRDARKTTWPDFTSYIIKHSHDGHGLSLLEIMPMQVYLCWLEVRPLLLCLLDVHITCSSIRRNIFGQFMGARRLCASI